MRPSVAYELDAECQDRVQDPSIVLFPKIFNEHSPQTLICQYNSNLSITAVYWIANDITEGALRINRSCLKLFWRNENLHSYTCDITKKI
jgi:hypothetical protein